MSSPPTHAMLTTDKAHKHTDKIAGYHIVELVDIMGNTPCHNGNPATRCLRDNVCRRGTSSSVERWPSRPVRGSILDQVLSNTLQGWRGGEGRGGGEKRGRGSWGRGMGRGGDGGKEVKEKERRKRRLSV